MAQEHRLLSLSDTDLIFQFSLSLASSTSDNTGFRASDDDGGAEEVDFVFDIDPSLLVDSDKLIIDQLVGEGPRSIVYKGWYEFRPVSIKVMLPEKTSDATSECKARFQREVNLISRIQHPNIVKFIGASVEPTMMIITQLLEGGSLQKHLESIYPKTLDLEQTISFALDISQAMEHLHANGIIHRDLKPGDHDVPSVTGLANVSNLLLDEDNMHIKLAEFGMAREEICGDMTSEAGTYRYMAPELFSKDSLLKGAKKRYDHKADVYSFAMVLWALTKNQIPFKGRTELMAAYATVQNMRPSVDQFPEYLLPLLQSCWAEDPKLRPEFREITKTLTKLLHKCRIAGKALPCPVPECVEDIYKELVHESQSHKTQNPNGCTEEQSHIEHTPRPSPLLEQTRPKKKTGKYKSLLLCYCKCFASF